MQKKTCNIQNKQLKDKLLWSREDFVTQTNNHNFDLSVDLTSGRSGEASKIYNYISTNHNLWSSTIKENKQLWYDAT